jgi:chromosome segregation ATPase
VASRSPEQLTKLFEQISGSDVLKQPYEEAAAAKRQAEDQVALLFAKRKTIVQERKQKKEQKDEAERHMAAQEELVRGSTWAAHKQAFPARFALWAVNWQTYWYAGVDQQNI